VDALRLSRCGQCARRWGTKAGVAWRLESRVAQAHLIVSRRLAHKLKVTVDPSARRQQRPRGRVATGVRVSVSACG